MIRKKPNDRNACVADSIHVRDSASRRQFIRVGSAFVLTGGFVASGQALADCDGSRYGRTGCSDQDTGTNSDATGCGRCETENIPSSSVPQTVDRAISIDRIKAPNSPIDLKKN